MLLNTLAMDFLDEKNGVWRLRGKFAAGILAAILFGFFAGRLTGEQPAPALLSAHLSPSSKAPPSATADSITLRSSAIAKEENPVPPERVVAIDEELAQIPTPRADELNALTESIRLRRLQAAQIRGQLRSSDRELLTESLAAAPDAATSMATYQQAILELEEELSDAKQALTDQQWYVGGFLGSDETPFILDIHAELKRRADKVAEIEKRIRDLRNEMAQDLNLANSQRAGQFQRWREQRAMLESSYAATLVAVEQETQAYSDLSASIAANQKRIAALRAERTSLVGTKPPP